MFPVDENGLTRMERQKLKKEAFLAKKAQSKEPSLTIKEPHGTIQLTVCISIAHGSKRSMFIIVQVREADLLFIRRLY